MMPPNLNVDPERRWPYDNVGFFAGLQAIYADLDLGGNEEIDDLLLWGPAVGLELRF